MKYYYKSNCPAQVFPLQWKNGSLDLRKITRQLNFDGYAETYSEGVILLKEFGMYPIQPVHIESFLNELKFSHQNNFFIVTIAGTQYSFYQVNWQKLFVEFLFNTETPSEWFVEVDKNKTRPAM